MPAATDYDKFKNRGFYVDRKAVGFFDILDEFPWTDPVEISKIEGMAVGDSVSVNLDGVNGKSFSPVVRLF